MTGAELKQIRKRLGLSLRVTAQQLECSVSTLCRWESGKCKVPDGAVKLLKIMNKLGVDRE